MALDVEWLGHASFKISDGESTVYVDPYQVQPGETADLVLITHQHHDHCSPEDVIMVAGPETVIAAPADCRPQLEGIGASLLDVAPNQEYEAGLVKFRTTPAYNTNKEFHPKEKGWVGYIIEMQGGSVYHSGDSDFIPEMEGLNVDVALLPVGGKYTMTADEAAEAAKAIGCKRAIPMHYGSIVGSEEDAERFRALLRD